MTSSIVLALLLPACSSGTVVLDDNTGAEDTGAVTDTGGEEEEEEEEEEVLPIAYSAEVAGFNERWGEYCTGQMELLLEDGVLTGSGQCETWGSATEINIQADVTDTELDGVGEAYLDAGWGDPIQESGELNGEADDKGVFAQFAIEVDFGGGGGGGGGGDQTFEFTIEGSAD